MDRACLEQLMMLGAMMMMNISVMMVRTMGTRANEDGVGINLDDGQDVEDCDDDDDEDGLVHLG